MTIDNAGATARFEIGRVISRTFRVIADNAVVFLALTTLLSFPAIIYNEFGVLAGLIGLHDPVPFASYLPAYSTGAIIARAIVGYAISIVFASLLEAAITQGAIVSLNGGKASFGECLSTAISNILPLLVIVLLATMAIILGFVVLIVPGVILWLMLCVVAQVRVVEHKGIMDTLSRSAELTRGYKGQIFGLFVIYFAVVVAIELIIRPLTVLAMIGQAGEVNTILYVIAAALVQIVFGLLNAAGTTSTYYELRLVKEGVGAEHLASVFA
jgi:hypothetical protein